MAKKLRSNNVAVLWSPWRAEVNLDSDRIGFYALRRREPVVQPLLREVSHRVPRKRFRE